MDKATFLLFRLFEASSCICDQDNKGKYSVCENVLKLINTHLDDRLENLRPTLMRREAFEYVES